MDTRLVDYDFAPDISKLHIDQILCVVVAPVCLDTNDGIHRLATIPSGCHCRFQGSLDKGMASYSLLRVKVIEATPIPLLAMVEQSIVLCHPHPSWEDSKAVIELCAGMGALGHGAASAGFRSTAACELRSTIATLYNQHCDAQMVVGDICEFGTLQALHCAHPRSAVLAAGISCQPYSRLGDCKSGSDERAQTLPATLASAHYLRALIVVLECVEPASRDAFVNWHVNQFCSRTGFHRTEAILQLSEIWPSKRARWWCILSAPAIGPVKLPALPKMFDLPSIRHVLPEIQKWEIAEERKLRLTPVELEAFSQESGSATKYLLNMKGVMPCALHAWGSQVLPCPCGCRLEGLSSSRLLSKGLFGVLAPCLALAEVSEERVQSQYRHLHPKEAALLCGLDPALSWSENLRLTLGAVGQLASPLQANWVFNHIKFALETSHFGSSQLQPVAELRAFRAWLLARAQLVWNFEEANMIPSEALSLSFHWKSLASMPMAELNSRKESLDVILRSLVETDQLRSSEAASIEDLTVTQVVIPSQDGGSRSPTSEVPTVDLESDFVVRVVVTTGNHLNDSVSQIRVKGPATVDNIVRAEQKIAQWPEGEVQCLSEGEVLEASAPLEPGMTLHIVIPSGAPFQEGPLCEPTFEDNPRATEEFVHPLTQIKGSKFLQMLPPQVTKVCQVEALRAQKISQHDRAIILANQGLLWGDDEIMWHLQQLQQGLSTTAVERLGKIAVLDPLLASGWVHGEDCNDIQTWFDINDWPQGIITAFLHQGHWIPLICACEETSIVAISIGDDDQDKWIVRCLVRKFRQALSLKASDCIFEKTQFEHTCCGAFAIAFIDHMLTQQQLPSNVQELESIHDYYRTLFMTTEQLLCPHPWIWGAGKDVVGTAVDKLVPFLRDRGVDPDQVKSRAQAAVKAIGATDVIKAVDSSNPWKSIKVIANNVKFQLVLHEELQQHIAGRAGTEVGKTSKKPRASRVPKQPDTIVLDPNKLQIPEGTFRSEEKVLQQLAPSQIGPLAMGIVVITLEEAEPFLKANKIVSNAPLALLVLNAPSARWSTHLTCTQVTVPARCIMNQEPLLLEASLIQIGTGVVSKHVGIEHPAIDTVKVSTFKVIVYKDEIQTAWDSFVGGPVKYIVSQIPILKLCPEKDCNCQCWHNPANEQVSAGIVDVWRRQYLRQGFRPESPNSATIFTVCIRVPSSIRNQVIGNAGQGGVYVEPRSLEATEVDSNFDVVWVPRADKSSVTHLRQTNPLVLGITRMGERWGLRVTADQAQTVHQAVRPDAVFLEQGPRLQYSVSPIPFGTDRQALSRALKSSGWEVKPIQPVGSVEGGRGNTWNVIATKPPPSNIIPMSHGEVVISKVKAPDHSKKEPMKPVAANLTLSLCGTGRSSHPSGAKDPWTVQDPWQSYQGPRPEAVTRGAIEASESLKQLEQKIEQAVLSKFPQQPVAMEQDDVPDRVSVLEKQVNTLMSKQQQIEVSLQEHHSHHTAQLSQLQGQLNAQSQQVAGQLESQQQSIKSMFDSQMAQIRGLLAKRPREDGE